MGGYIGLKTAHEIGFTDAMMLDAVPFRSLREERQCIRFPRQAQFHVLK